MLQKLKTKQGQSGFTIIEVMIVLAIAGLILLIVFLAVPALQRNAHNTSAKNDVSGLLGAMNEYVNNNNGTVPTKVTANGQNAVQFGGATACGTAGANCSDAKIGYYTSGQVTLSTAFTNAFPASGVKIVENATCNGNTPAAGTGRNYVALFTLEGGAQECTAS